MTTPPSATGKASRHRPSACARPRCAARSGFGCSRGRKGVVPGIPITSASSGSSRVASRSSIARRSASACATDGGPASTAAAVRVAAQRAEDAAADGLGRGGERQAEAASARCARLPRGRTDSRARTPGSCGWLRTSETPKSGTRSASARSTSVADAPALGAARLEQRLGRGAPLGLGVRSREQRRRASVQDGLSRAHHDDEVRLHELARDPHPGRTGGHPDERRVGGIVHGQLAVEAAAQLRRDERGDLGPAGATGEAAGNEQRLAVGRHAELHERVAHRRDGPAARIVLRASERQRGRLDDDGHPGGACCERLERLAVEWKAERLPCRRLDVGRAARRWRAQDARVAGRGRHDEARAGEERDARHRRRVSRSSGAAAGTWCGTRASARSGTRAGSSRASRSPSCRSRGRGPTRTRRR